MARKAIGTGAEWEQELLDALNDFVGDEKRIADAVFKQVANNTRDKLRASSPKESGDYAKGWEVKAKASGITGKGVTYIVCNPKHYQLTHLLERGHQSFNQFGGPYKRVRARKHIKPAEVYGNELLLKRLREKL